MIIDIHLEIESLGIDDIYQFEITDFEVGYHCPHTGYTGDNIEFDVFWRGIPNGFLNGYLRYHDMFLTQLFSVAKEMQQKDETKGEASIKLEI